MAGIRRRRIFTLALAAAVAGCGGEATGSARVEATRATLEGGAVLVRYGALPDSADRNAFEDLRIGALEGDPAYVFGDVRGIQAGPDGTVYVLDYQASEIRAFDASGAYLGTIATEGGGPGELREANGMILSGDSILWVQDHAKGQFIALRTDGTEARTVPMHVQNYSYMWNGTVDDAGRFWKPTSHSDEPWRPPEEGLHESSSRSYLVSYDPATERRDSVFLGVSTARYYVTRFGGGGYSSRGVPNQHRPETIVNPSGGFWRSDGSVYRIVRLSESGDTTLVIEADVPPPPVTNEDRDAVVQQAEAMDRGEAYVRGAEALVAAMPETKPAISGLVVDDLGRLWVRRGEGGNAGPRYDVFSASGDFEMTIELPFRPSEYLPIEIAGGNVYALVRDELEVPYVVRAAIE